MSNFLSQLYMEYMIGPKGMPLKNPDGGQIYKVMAPLVYQSDVAGRTIVVPEGFFTDLASIPRLPFVYRELNGAADLPGVVHDYVYSSGILTRNLADKLLREACLLVGVSPVKAWMIYTGVRVGGASHYAQSPESKPEDYKK